MDIDLGSVFVPTESGEFVDQRHARIAEIIQDYDPELELAWIPPDKREEGDKPFAVIHRPLGKPVYVAFYVDECDERILQRIWAGDVKHHRGTIMTQLDARNASVKAMQLKKQMDEMDDAADQAKHVFQSPKSTYTIGDTIIHSDKPYEKRPRPKIL